MKNLEKVEIYLFMMICFLIFLYYTMYEISLTSIHNFLLEYQEIIIIIYFLLYIVFALMLFSVITLTFLGGILFDFKLAFLLSFSAMTISTCIAFFIIRIISNKVNPNFHFKFLEKIKSRLEQNLESNKLYKLSILRIVFPTIVFSYGAGLVKKVSVKDFCIVTILINLLTVFIVLFFGIEIIKNPMFILYGIIFLILIYFLKNQITKLKIFEKIKS